MQVSLKKKKLLVFLACGGIVLLSVLALYYKQGWNAADGQLREIAHNVDTVNSVIKDLRGLYARGRADVILRQIQSQHGDLLIVFGDSIVEQMFFPEISGYNVLNAGISGARALDAKPFLQKLLALSHGPLVVLAMGTNDALDQHAASPEQFAAGYEDLARTILASGRKLVLVTVPPMEPGKAASSQLNGDRLKAYNAVIRDVGRRTGAVVADVDAALTKRQAGRTESFTLDGVHLDAGAAAVWRDTVYAAIRRQLGG